MAQTQHICEILFLKSETVRSPAPVILAPPNQPINAVLVVSMSIAGHEEESDEKQKEKRE